MTNFDTSISFEYKLDDKLANFTSWFNSKETNRFLGHATHQELRGGVGQGVPATAITMLSSSTSTVASFVMATNGEGTLPLINSELDIDSNWRDGWNG